jgi:hypothetical protein
MRGAMASMLKSQSCKVVTFFKNDTDWFMIVSQQLWRQSPSFANDVTSNSKNGEVCANILHRQLKCP